MAVIPIMIDLQEKKVVIVGGGKVAKRRLESLLESEADITVISPEALPEIQELSLLGNIKWKQKEVSKHDLTEAFFIIIATNDYSVNEAVKKYAPAHSLVNSSFEAEEGNVHFPSHFKRGKLSIAVSTHGASPLLASKIKNEIASHFDENFESYLEFLYEARKLIKEKNLSRQEKDNYLREILKNSYQAPELQENMLKKLRTL